MAGYRSCPKFWEAIEAYGTDCWRSEILWDGLTSDEATIFEQVEIQDNETLYPYGYNIEIGNEAPRSDETRRKQSEARKISLNQRAVRTIIFMGKPFLILIERHSPNP